MTSILCARHKVLMFKHGGLWQERVERVIARRDIKFGMGISWSIVVR